MYGDDQGEDGASTRNGATQHETALERGLRRSVSTAEPRWRSLLGVVRSVQMEVKRRAPQRQIGLAGNPAAPESAIVVAELRLGRRLPPSYREFLAFSDGWPCFFEGASLLGTGEIGRSALSERADRRVLGRERLLPFGKDRDGTSLFAFDTSVRRADGEFPVVAWVGGLGLDCRCFTSFLATVLQLCRSELTALRAADAAATDSVSTRRIDAEVAANGAPTSDPSARESWSEHHGSRVVAAQKRGAR